MTGVMVMGNTHWCHLSGLLTLRQWRRQHVAVTKSAAYFGSCYAEDLDMLVLVLLLLLQLLLLLFMCAAVLKFSGTRMFRPTAKAMVAELVVRHLVVATKSPPVVL